MLHGKRADGAFALTFLLAILLLSSASSRRVPAPAPIPAPAASPLESYWKLGKKKYPAGKDFHCAKAWAPGQFVLEGETVDGNREAVNGFLILEQTAGGWIVEVSNVDDTGATHVIQVLIAGVEGAIAANDLSLLRLVWVKSRGKDGKVNLIQGLPLELGSALARPVKEKIVVNLANPSRGGRVSVPAGAFADTSLGVIKSRELFSSSETKAWYNAAVPINGLVKSVSGDGKRVTELIAFGFNGTSRF